MSTAAEHDLESDPHASGEVDDASGVDPDGVLCRSHLLDMPGIGGRIKARPEDFLVDEIPQYEPAGAGEHLYLRIEKTGVSHGELIAVLRRAFGVPESAIGYAGMKDKHAVTRQTVSIHLPGGGGPVPDLAHDRIRVLWADRHGNKLRRGHLRGNRFVVRIREVDPVRAPQVMRGLRLLEASGVPAAFGPQRFGYRLNNHRIGAAIVRRDWRGALDELLGAGGAPFPERQRARRDAYDQGRFADAAAEWTPSDRAELLAARALARDRSPAEAVQSAGWPMLSFWTAALASAAFNRVLQERLAGRRLHVLEPGDLAWKRDSRAVFRVTEALIAEGSLPPRIARGEITPSGPMWGAGMTCAEGAVRAAEERALTGFGVSPDAVLHCRHMAGSRRPLLVPLSGIDCEGGFDQHGPAITVSFELPRGAFATAVLAELMKLGAPPPA
ncbi:MAG: tRNA pseudouridine(13) synthase TruD [Phycisphaeraceae bacterium]|nr:tRNA pseudouridine(13) synthase TruD [Phycisphaeraceae bacterium]